MRNTAAQPSISIGARGVPLSSQVTPKPKVVPSIRLSSGPFMSAPYFFASRSITRNSKPR
ncbi:hypothetical protein D3C80_1780970 [compost metagenome]